MPSESVLTKLLGIWLIMREVVKVFSWYKVPPPLTYICLGGNEDLNW